MKLSKFALITGIAIVFLTAKASFASAALESVEKGYGESFGVKNIPANERSTMGVSFPELVGTEIDGIVVKENDVVILSNVSEKNLSEYAKHYNGIRNVFTWIENSDGTIGKLYGGTDKSTFGRFYAYADGFSNYAVNLSENPPLLYSLGGYYDDAGGPWNFIPYKNNGTITFGHYDLDMKGASKFTLKFALHSEGSNNDEWATGLAFGIYLVQGEDGYKKDAQKQLKIYANDTKNNATLYNGSDKEKTFKVPASGYLSFLTFELYVDTRGDIPRARVYLYDKSGKLYAETDWFTSDELSAFDFEKSMGIKFHIEDNSYQKGDIFQISKFKFEKRHFMEMVSVQEDFDKLKVPISKGSISVEFDADLDGTKLGDGRVAVIDEEGNSVSFSPEVSGKILTLSFVKLQPETKYRIVFNEIMPINGDGYSGEISFKSTESAKLMTGSAEKNDGKADVSVNLKNYSGTAETYTVLLAVIKDGNMLPGVYYKKVKLLGRKDKDIVFSGIDIGEAGTYTFKAYVMDTFDGMNLISGGITITDTE